MTSTSLLNNNLSKLFGLNIKSKKIFALAFAIFPILGAFATYGAIFANYYESTIDKEEFFYYASNAMTAVSTICGLLIAVSFYKPLFDKRKVDFYQALPITRQSEFLLNSLTATLFFAIQYIVNIICYKVAVNAVAVGLKFSTPVTTTDILASELLPILIGLATYLLIQICAVSSGTYGQMRRFTVMSIFFGYWATYVIHSYINLLPGANHIETAWLGYLNPFSIFTTMALDGINYANTSSTNISVPADLCIAAVVSIFLFYLIGAYIYQKRPNENASTKVCNNPWAMICIALLQISCFSFFVFNVYNLSNIYKPILLSIAAGIIVTAVLSLIFYGKKLNKKLFAQFGIIGVVLSLTGVIFVTGGFGYSTNIPNVEDVESVTVYDKYTTNSWFDGSLSSSSHGMAYYFANDENMTSQTLTDEESIKKVIEANEIIAKQDKEISKNYDTSSTVTIKYELKNGRTMTRSFFVHTYEALALADIDERQEKSLSSITEDNFIGVTIPIFDSEDSLSYGSYSSYNTELKTDYSDFLDVKDDFVALDYDDYKNMDIDSSLDCYSYEPCTVYYLADDTPQEEIDKFKDTQNKQSEDYEVMLVESEYIRSIIIYFPFYANYAQDFSQSDVEYINIVPVKITQEYGIPMYRLYQNYSYAETVNFDPTIIFNHSVSFSYDTYTVNDSNIINDIYNNVDFDADQATLFTENDSQGYIVSFTLGANNGYYINSKSYFVPTVNGMSVDEVIKDDDDTTLTEYNVDVDVTNETIIYE